MKKTFLFNFDVDKAHKQIKIKRSFDAPRDLVWSAWTEAEILDQWWAPQPYINKTKSMHFHEGGHWLYSMTGPEGDIHWCKVDYETIRSNTYFSGYDGFCDEEGVINIAMPRNKWENTFNEQDNQTIVDILLTFDALEDLEKVIEMGFKEGFTAGLENLDQYIEAQFKLRSQNKKYKYSVSTYLNFAGNTEEAFTFYKEVFRSDFIDKIQRFGDLPPDPTHPPIADSVKNMVLHVELPILDGFLLMGTDAPKEMGFSVSAGNNMHIQLMPASKEEATRIFNELSEGGSISMPLQDTFWGAYFGSFTDKFGINWMINFSMNY